jgi:uncharacterized protein (TIGR03067 family)
VIGPLPVVAAGSVPHNRTDGEVLLQAGNHKLDPSKSPKTINAMIAQGERKGDILLGIYELDGDTFKVCFDAQAEKRPVDFK